MGITVLLAAAALTICSACDDNANHEYTGGVDLNLLSLTQAREAWDGAECNHTWNISESDANQASISYKLSISLYQNKTAEREADVRLLVDKDSLDKAIALAPEGGNYAKYAGAQLLPEEYYMLSADELTLRANQKESDEASVVIYSDKLIDFVQNTLLQDAVYVLPLKIAESSSYTINPLTDAMMLFVNVKYIAPEDPEAYVPDRVGVPDDHTLANGMKILWHDEFNGAGAPNPDIWQFEQGFVRNEEDQWYQSGNATMLDGALLIEGRKEAVKNPNYQAGSSDWKKNREYSEYTSSSIVTTGKYAFKYGRMEVRAKIPVAQGSWPAIWSTGNWWEWPLGGEIDMMEFYKENIHANLCWGGSSRWQGTWNSRYYPLTDFTSEDKKWTEKYHLWVMDWDKDFIRIYLDGKLMNETDLTTTVNKGDNGAGEGGYQNPFSNDYTGFGQRMMLNLAIGGNNGRPVNNAAFPLQYYIDYIRIYQ
jgi:beta-glucanase (GH16 family)